MEGLQLFSSSKNLTGQLHQVFGRRVLVSVMVHKYIASETVSKSEEVKFSLKVVMNKEENKVLFAEVDSSLAEVLLSFLTLPLGTIVRLLVKHYANEPPSIGSLNTLYQGLVNLDSSNFWTDRSYAAQSKKSI